jgi:zinc protease
MKKSNGLRAFLLLSYCILLSMGFPQTRKVPGTAPKPAPFLQYVKFYRETPYVTKVILKNGMSVVVNEYRAQPVISSQVYVRAGLLDETAQNPGLTQLLAAMIYRGPADKASGTFRQNVQSLGGSLRESTDWKHTCFEIVAPSSQWKRAIDIQANAILNPALDPDDVKREAALIQSEARGALDRPEEFFREQLLEMGFNQADIGRWSVLSRSPLGTITREALSAFHKAAYVPSAMTLVVSGDVNSSEVLNEIVKVYDKTASAAVRPPGRTVETSQRGFRYRGIRRNVPYPELLFGFHTAGAKAEDNFALQILSALLGTGEGSILSSRLREQKKLIFDEETELVSGPDFGFLTLRLSTGIQDIDKTEIAALTELELLKQNEPEEWQMERALAQLERNYWTQIETVTGKASTLAYFELLGDWEKMDRYLANLRKVKAPDIKRVANKYLNLDNCSLLEILPVAAEERNLSTENLRRTLESLLAPATSQEQEAREKETVPAVTIPQGGSAFKYSEIRYPFQVASILRGPDMFVREDHTSPLINMGIFFAGGKLAETAENNGITSLLAGMLLRGAKGQSAAQFYRQLEIYGGTVQPVVTDDFFGLYFSILSNNFEAGFGLLRDHIKSPDFDKDEVGRQKQMQLREILRLKQTGKYPRELMYRALFGNFPYGLPTAGSETSLTGLDESSVQRWYDTYIKNKKPIVIGVGDTKGTSLASYFVQHFSGSRFGDNKIPEASAKPLESGSAQEKEWSNNRSMILVGFQAPPEDDEDRYVMAVLEKYAGGLGRFSEALRERLAKAYSATFEYEPRLRGGSIIACAEINPADEDAVLQALQEEIKRLARDPVIYREYRSAINAAMAAYWIRNQDRLPQILEVAENLLAGVGVDGFQNYASALQGVQEEDLADVAQRAFRMEKAVILRVRGKPVNQ